VPIELRGLPLRKLTSCSVGVSYRDATMAADPTALPNNLTHICLQQYETISTTLFDNLDWLVGCLTARQHRKVNVCQLWGRETGLVG